MTPASPIALVVPVLNEAAGLADFLTALPWGEETFTVTLADGGSTDGTLDIAVRFAAPVATCTARRGRGAQMNAGARASQGDVLLFLHADSRLPPGALGKIRRALADPAVAAGSFSLAFDHDHPGLRFYALCSRLPHPLFTYGDQGLFLRRAVFEEVSGFAELPLMEDLDILARLRRVGRVVKLADPVTSSARRFLRHGIVRQQALNAALVALWHLGVTPQRLARIYYGDRNEERREGDWRRRSDSNR